MKAMHALSAFALAGAALFGGDAIALAQPAPATMATAVAPAPAPAPQPRGGTFMKVEGMTGASTDRTHPGWIEIAGFQWGVGRGMTNATGSASDRQGSKPSVSEIVIVKQTDSSSPKLMQASTSGKHFTEVVIDFVRPDKQVYYQVKLKDVIISRFALSSGGDRPTESLTLNFTKVEWTYASQKPDGSAGAPQTPPATWDLAQVTSS